MKVDSLTPRRAVDSMYDWLADGIRFVRVMIDVSSDLLLEFGEHEDHYSDWLAIHAAEEWVRGMGLDAQDARDVILEALRKKEE